MKFYLDENVPAAVRDGLKKRGHEVLRVVDWKALRGLNDEQHAQIAQAGEMILISSDKGFCKMKTLRNMPATGVIWAGRDLLRLKQHRQRLFGAIEQYREEIERGGFLTLGARRVRLT